MPTKENKNKLFYEIMLSLCHVFILSSKYKMLFQFFNLLTIYVYLALLFLIHYAISDIQSDYLFQIHFC